jgi:nitrous oxidase accessory protein NosD
MKALATGVAAIALIAALAGGVFAFRGRGAVPDGCATTVSPGGDVSAALFRAAAGDTVCLAAGVHRPVSTARVRPDVSLIGEGPERTTIQADGGSGIDITDVERFTLAGLSVRGGAPAAVFVTRARDVTLRNIRLGPAAFGLHVEGATIAASDLAVAGTSDFGILLRRGGAATIDGLRLTEARGIGIGAVDDPGPLTLRDAQLTREGRANRGESIVLNGWQRFTLENVTVRGGNPAGIYAARARELTLRAVHVESANFGLHLDENATATADDLSLLGSTGVGLLLQRGGTLTARALRVLDTAGTGVSAINGAGQLTLRDSEISRVVAAGLFAGVAGCEDLPPASLDVPACFYENVDDRISTIRVSLERVRMEGTRGPCLVFFPGVHATVRDSSFTRCELTGLFAWGATADVSNSTFEDNAEHALEYRAFPDPRGQVIAAAAGTIEDSIIRGTRPLEGEILGAAGPGPVLGGGILAQGADLRLHRNEITANRDIGASFVNRSTGEIVANRITDNGNYGLCLLPGTAVQVRDNTITGNRSDSPTACGGRPAP